MPVTHSEKRSSGSSRLRPRLWSVLGWVATRRHGASRSVVVLKGARTVVAGPKGEVSVDPHEVPALATGGTGDVLSGVIGAFLAQGLEPFPAAVTAVSLHPPARRRTQ